MPALHRRLAQQKPQAISATPKKNHQKPAGRTSANTMSTPKTIIKKQARAQNGRRLCIKNHRPPYRIVPFYAAGDDFDTLSYSNMDACSLKKSGITGQAFSSLSMVSEASFAP